MSLAGARIGPLNCYEDVIADFALEVTRGAPDFLVNVTNDAWFGDSAEPYLHEQVARLRSIETRRDLVRSVNTGVSSHITATGAEAVHTESYERIGFLADVRKMTGFTPWVRYGDLYSPAFYLTLFWLFLVVRRERTGTSYLRPRGF
jgi:apolipoprotein N-acyltransferase